ncbi:MAG TPA: ComF family protein [Pyrinomonadaceae bacterium]
MFLTHATRLFYDALLTLSYPQSCAICGCSVEERRFGVACAACWSATRILSGTETICWKCGLLSDEVAPVLGDEVRCRRCGAHSFTAARAIGPYEGALRASVLELKRQPHISQHLEMLLLAAAKREPLNRGARIIPVPLHDRRLRSRGFNQASILAQVLSRGLRLPLDEVSLVRVSSTEKYRAGLDAKGRHDTVAGAFEVRHPRLIANEDLLLVDDVFTTGATVSACAETLTGAGARNVFVLTLARA